MIQVCIVVILSLCPHLCVALLKIFNHSTLNFHAKYYESLKYRVGTGVRRHVNVNRNITENKPIRTPTFLVKICSTIIGLPRDIVFINIDGSQC